MDNTPDNQLEVIVQESGLDSTKAQVLLDLFTDYFKIAAEWEVKAKAIVVTDASQVGDMEMAKAGRLFLKRKRVAIETTRKELKKQALQEGKAIDGIANILKALIVPIEDHLNRQEKFVELRDKQIAADKMIEEARKLKADRLAAEEAERVERERIKADNDRLHKEAAEKDRIHAEERAKVEADRVAAEQKANDERRIAEEGKARAQAEIETLKQEAEGRLALSPIVRPTNNTIACSECGALLDLADSNPLNDLIDTSVYDAMSDAEKLHVQNQCQGNFNRRTVVTPDWDLILAGLKDGREQPGFALKPKAE